MKIENRQIWNYKSREEWEILKKAVLDSGRQWFSTHTYTEGGEDCVKIYSYSPTTETRRYFHERGEAILQIEANYEIY